MAGIAYNFGRPLTSEYYKPGDIVEEILLEKVVVETARYGRVLSVEQPEPRTLAEPEDALGKGEAA